MTTKKTVHSVSLKYTILSISCSLHESYIAIAGFRFESNRTSWDVFSALSKSSPNKCEPVEEGVLQILNVNPFKRVKIFDRFLSNYVTSISISIDGQLVVAAVLDTRSFKNDLIMLKTSPIKEFTKISSCLERTKLLAISISPDKELIATGDKDGKVKLTSLSLVVSSSIT